MIDLASALIAAIQANRELLNTSRIARGEAGRIEINVNPAMKRVTVNVMVPEKRRVA